MECEKKYILKSKNVPILEFMCVNKQSKANIYVHFEYICEVKILTPELLPFGIDSDPTKIEDSLTLWLSNRRLQEDREFSKKIILTLIDHRGNFQEHVANPLMRIVDRTYALSLNDTYWVVEHGSRVDWEGVSLYSAPFDVNVSDAAFLGTDYSATDIILSPEYTTAGALKKTWERNGDNIVLHKGSQRNGVKGMAPLAEFISSQVAAVLGFPHVDYVLSKYRGEVVSSSSLFTRERVSFAPSYMLDNTFINSSSLYKEFFEDIMLFDAIIGNSDRHKGNYGVLFDSNTNEIIAPAPIFDNGNSFAACLSDDAFFLREKAPSVLKRGFTTTKSKQGIKFVDQLKKFVRKRHRHSLEKLTKFEIKESDVYSVEKWQLDAYMDYLHWAAHIALREL